MMTEKIGPVQLVVIGFPPEAEFEGRIMDELERLERHETIRILDLLFVGKDAETGISSPSTTRAKSWARSSARCLASSSKTTTAASNRAEQRKVSRATLSGSRKGRCRRWRPRCTLATLQASSL